MSEEKDSDLTKPEKGGVGPFTLERQGRVISIKSSVQQSRSDIVERMHDSHPKIKKDIDDEIAILLKLMESYDPTDFLISVSWNNCFCDPETYTESQHEGLEAYAEYALSLALTKSIDKERPHALEENLEVFSKTIISIFDKIALFFITERSEKSGDNELHKFRYSSIMSSLYLRGDSTEIHHLDLVRDLFEQQHNGFLLQSFGYDISQIISCVDEILKQINENVNKQKEFFSEVADLHKSYNEYSDRPENKSKIDETLAEEFFSIVENKERKDQLQSRKTDLSENVFEIIPNEKLPLDLLIE